MFRGETTTLTRDCEAVLVPAGHRVIIPEGTEVTITQALGGSFTIYAGGSLARIAGEDGDALGREPLEKFEIAEDASRDEVEAAVTAQLKTVFDPEIPINIVDLGLVYECATVELEPNRYRIEAKLTLTAPGCGMGDILIDDARNKLLTIPQIAEVDIELVFDPPWNQGMMSDEARLQTGMYY
ncbi:MAG TPA: putative Fe-S cluster assembly protein SufT [Gammaproteobacteria bacterium]|nr:putative Fe-S cluster assembly protein SufT [Gammaproteobacteria bacterium]